MHTETLEYRDGDTVLEAFVADNQPESQKPLVLVAHDWAGRRDQAGAAARYLADLGYVGFALDMYGKGVVGEDGDTEGNAALMNPFAEDRALLRRRITAALDTGRSLDSVDAARVAAIGYCFGGMCVLELARSGADICGVASIHGLFAPGEIANEEIRARILALHGHDDPLAPPEQVQAFAKEMSEAGADWQIHVYGNTQHAFTNPQADDPELGTVYNELAARRAYHSLEAFLFEIFE